MAKSLETSTNHNNCELLHEIIHRFPIWQQALWWFAVNHLYKISDDVETQESLKQLNEDIRTGGAIINGDHQFPTDFFPLGAAFLNQLGKEIHNPISNALVPHAFQLISGVAPKENASSYEQTLYRHRAEWFRRFSHQVSQNSVVSLMPVIRDFEKSHPHIYEQFEMQFGKIDVNSTFALTLIKAAAKTDQNPGLILFISLAAGINFPGRAAIHQNLHGIIHKSQEKSSNGLPIYVSGAYPQNGIYPQLWPLRSRYNIRISRFGHLTEDYENDTQQMQSTLEKLRSEGLRELPNYEKMKAK